MPRKGFLNRVTTSFDVIFDMFSKLTTYLSETRTELRRVVWPSRQDTTKHTLAVIGISAAVAVFLGALDILFQYLLETFIL